MARSVNAAFSQFSSEVVDLDPEQVSLARASHNWLIDQIERFPYTIVGFPDIYYAENNVKFGSFSRKTKKRPLDDIDFIVVFSGMGSTYSSFFNIINIHVPPLVTKLCSLADNGHLNSIKVLNKLLHSLKDVPQYSKAEIHRKQEAVTLKLLSYPWNFDIVPAFITEQDNNGRSYYLIPDGKGYWKKTDPRIDAILTTQVNQMHDGRLLKIIRLIKYWNNRPIAPKMESYLLENIILKFFANSPKIINREFAIRDFFQYLSWAIYEACYDPKGIQGDLNQLDFIARNKISLAASEVQRTATSAIYYSALGDHINAINQWKLIFGNNFPEYS